jgi:hypothetical protein
MQWTLFFDVEDHRDDVIEAAGSRYVGTTREGYVVLDTGLPSVDGERGIAVTVNTSTPDPTDNSTVNTLSQALGDHCRRLRAPIPDDGYLETVENQTWSEDGEGGTDDEGGTDNEGGTDGEGGTEDMDDTDGFGTGQQGTEPGGVAAEQGDAPGGPA